MLINHKLLDTIDTIPDAIPDAHPQANKVYQM